MIVGKVHSVVDLLGYKRQEKQKCWTYFKHDHEKNWSGTPVIPTKFLWSEPDPSKSNHYSKKKKKNAAKFHWSYTELKCNFKLQLNKVHDSVVMYTVY